jgi:hypothetical protein
VQDCCIKTEIPPSSRRAINDATFEVVPEAAFAIESAWRGYDYFMKSELTEWLRGAGIILGLLQAEVEGRPGPYRGRRWTLLNIRLETVQ